MLQPGQKIALYMEQNLDSRLGKMGHGVMRYSSNPITCVIDSKFAGKRVNQAVDLPFDFPVVNNINQALELGAEVLVLGISPSGGRVPDEWQQPIQEAIQKGLSIVNGLHDNLNNQFTKLKPNQWIWDIRQPQFTPEIATGKAANLPNKRVLFVGTDMAIGKMTAGLEIYKYLLNQSSQRNQSVDFLATGQIGITVTGKGIPLDAFKVDHACGAVEQMVMQAKEKDIVLIEGQGSLLHPGSTATLPLMRGSCPSHLILCHRAGMTMLSKPEHIKTPPIKDFIQLNESLTAVCGSMNKATTIGIALNTVHLDDNAAKQAIAALEEETDLPVDDVVRYGAEKLAERLLS